MCGVGQSGWAVRETPVFVSLEDVTVANGTAELLHTEHIWYPRIREVMWALPFAVTLSSSS